MAASRRLVVGRVAAVPRPPHTKVAAGVASTRRLVVGRVAAVLRALIYPPPRAARPDCQPIRSARHRWLLGLGGGTETLMRAPLWDAGGPGLMEKVVC